jgi:hypothetical protein
MTAEKSGSDSIEDRLVNWAGWVNRLEPVDEVDAKLVDSIIKKMPRESREVVKAVYVQWPKQSIYFVAAELAIPPTFINRTIEKVKNDLAR